MKKRGFFVFFTFIILTFFNIVSASSFDISISPDKVTSKKGETVAVDLSLKDIEMGSNGINVIEGFIDYDKNTIDDISIKDCDWNFTYNSDEKSDLYGKFILVNQTKNVKDDEKVLTLNIKLKDKTKLKSTKVILKDITSNDDKNLVNIGNREVEIKFDEENLVDNKLDNDNNINDESKVVNTGDTMFVIPIFVIVSIVVLNIFVSRKKVEVSKH